MTQSQQAVGLIAGWGDYPVVIAKQLASENIKVVTVGVHGHTSPELQELSDEYTQLGRGKLERSTCGGWLVDC